MTDREDRITEFRNNIANDRWSKGASELGEEIIAYITDNQAPFPTTLVNVYMWAITEGVCRLFNPFNEWEEADERLLFFITHPKYQQLSLMGHLFNYLALQLRKEYAYPEGVIDKMLEYWQRYQLNEKDLLVGVANRLSGESWMIDGKLSSAGRYLAGALVKNYKGVFRLVSDEQIEHRLLKFMLAHNVALADHVLSDFINIRTDYIGLKYVSWLNVEVLLENNPFKYEPYIMAKLAELDSPEAIHYLTELLIKYLPGKYKTEANRFSFMYLNAAKTLVLQKRSDYRERNIQILDESGKRIGYCFLVCLHSKRILDSSEEVLPYIAELFGAYEAAYLKRELLDLFVTHYKEAFYPYLITEGFKVDPSYEFDGYMKEVFKYLLNIDFDLYKYKLIELCYSKLKKVREVAAVFIAKQGERAIPEATAL
ncbi:MAG TPA: hypothetical protein VGE24_02165, partial [Emticicia sp.]